LAGNTSTWTILSRHAVSLGVFSTVINVLLLVMPIYMIQVYDRVLPAASGNTLVYLSIMAVAALGFLGLIETIRAVYFLRIAASIDRQLASGAFEAALSGPRADSGDVQPLRDLSTVRSFIASRGLATLFDLPFAPLFVLLLALVHPALLWITLGGAAVMIILVLLNGIAVKSVAAEAGEMFSKTDLTAQAFARNGDTLRAMGMERDAGAVWGKAFVKALNAFDRSATVNSIFSGISRAVRMLLQIAILGFGAWLVLHGQMTAGMIFASSILAGRALQPLDQLVAGWKQTTDAWRAWKRLRYIVPEDRHRRAKMQLPEPVGKITVQQVVFIPPGAPPGTEPILKRVSFQLEAGESLAIIGPSRAGKSTLVRLMVGASRPSAGAIRIDGADLESWDKSQLGKYVGYLAQDIQLFPGTIAENVSRFDQNASDEAVVEAAQRARAHQLILSQRDGYQTMIGSVSSALSGGERQRIGLARAFYANPRILVLDEPNSNLDQEGEEALARAVAGARERKATVIIVTHRPSIAMTCDKVLMMRDGMVEAFGPSADILNKVVGLRTTPPQTPAPAQKPQGQLRSVGPVGKVLAE
jgi:PrtD family type I secretion system ABC transporter